MKNESKIIAYAVIAAFSGFLFGFDMVVISGADQTLQKLWHSTSIFHGVVVMSTALWGTVLGSVYGHLPTNYFGRKKSLLFVGIIFAISALGSAFAINPISFGIARFIGGIGIGISTIAAPSYIAEIAPENNRGRLVGLYQFNIVLGILSAYLSNYYFAEFGVNAWRWMLGIQTLPAVLFSMCTLLLVESSRWKLNSERNKEKESIFQPRYRKVLWLVFFIALFNQFSGINAFLYYAPRIFELAGYNASSAYLSSIGAGIINLFFTMIGLALIDYFGRKKLLWIGGLGYILSLGLVSVYFFLNWSGPIVSFFFFLFIAAHAIGQGAVIWVFISEIFPDHLRAKGQAFGSTIHWILAASIPALMPYLFDTIGAGTVFEIFTGMMLLQLFWIKKFVPETKGKTLEEINRELIL